MIEKTVVIHQPDFLPYLGFFDRLLKSNLYVILDNVQFVSGTSKSWQNRDKIKTPDGEKWITVGVQKAPHRTNINNILLSKSSDWRKRNLNLIKESYSKSLFFEEIFPFIQSLYEYECEKLVDFNLKSIYMLMELFDIHIETILASSLDVEGKSNQLLVNILKKVQANTYLSGIGARSYYESGPFEKANIKVVWQNFSHPVYPQLYGEFMPYLSSIDLLFNCGIENSRKIMRGDQD